MRDNVSKLLTNSIAITEKNMKQAKQFIFVHKIDKEDLKLQQNLEKNLSTTKWRPKFSKA